MKVMSAKSHEQLFIKQHPLHFEAMTWLTIRQQYVDILLKMKLDEDLM